MSNVEKVRRRFMGVLSTTVNTGSRRVKKNLHSLVSKLNHSAIITNGKTECVSINHDNLRYYVVISSNASDGISECFRNNRSDFWFNIKLLEYFPNGGFFRFRS